MADETKQVEEEKIDATDEKDTDTQQSKSETTFSQADVNKIVAKEKAAWKRSHDKNKDEWSETETTLRADIEKRDKVIQEQVDFLIKDLDVDEITQELLKDKDALEQFTLLVKIADKKGKVEIPRTPKGIKKEAEFRTNFNPNL